MLCGILHVESGSVHTQTGVYSVMMEKIDHIGVIVKDIEAVTSIYKKIGFEIESEEVIEATKAKVAFFPIGETYIELVEPAEMKKSEVTGLDLSKEGIHHVAIKVACIDDSVRELKKKGIKLLPYFEKPRRGARGSKVVFIDPGYTGKVLLELVERTE